MSAARNEFYLENLGALMDATMAVNRVKQGEQAALTPEQVATLHTMGMKEMDNRHPDARRLASCVVALAKTVEYRRTTDDPTVDPY